MSRALTQRREIAHELDPLCSEIGAVGTEQLRLDGVKADRAVGQASISRSSSGTNAVVKTSERSHPTRASIQARFALARSPAAALAASVRALASAGIDVRDELGPVLFGAVVKHRRPPALRPDENAQRRDARQDESTSAETTRGQHTIVSL